MSQSEMDAGRIREEGMQSFAELDGSDPQAIERRIDATRADMRATLEALERRLSFDRLIELTIGRARARGGEFAGNLTDAATHNPIPMLLTSIGLGWMMLTSRQGSRSARSTFNASDRAHGVADKMHGAMDSARDTLEQSTESARSGIRRASATAREQVDYAHERIEHTRERLDRLLDEQPLMLGAIGLAAGAILGALVPTTEHENRWLGDARDKAVRSVAEKTRAGYEAAREHAAVYSAPGRESEAEREQATQRPH